jgi:EPS-associated MarR family transcriptional regulator
MHKSDTEYLVLKKLEANPHLTQRKLSKELGLSLGKTNYVINALIDKGWLKLNNFKRSDKKLGYIYLLTPKGFAEKTKLAQKFLRRKSEEYNRLKTEIEKLKNELWRN